MKGLISNSNKLLGGADDTASNLPNELAIREEDDDQAGFCISDLPSANDPFEDSQHVSNESARKDSELAQCTNHNLSPISEPPLIRQQNEAIIDEEHEEKKMAICTTYEGFSVHGRVLCLVIKRINSSNNSLSGPSGPASMEKWISSTQVPIQEIS